MLWKLAITSEVQPVREQKSYHISQGALDLKTLSEEDNFGHTQLWARSSHHNVLLATLSRQIPQVSLDLAIDANEKVKYFVDGKGTIHLSGYFIPEEDEDIQTTTSNSSKPKKSKTSNEELKYRDVIEEVHKGRSRRAKGSETKTNIPEPEDTAIPNTELSNGIVFEEIHKGKGRRAKVGDHIAIYYENQLEASGSVVGNVQSGEGLQFVLGQKDSKIIPAWDVAIVGMKIGSKRKIICPPETAYGENGFPPIIPGHSTVVSIVELIHIVQRPLSKIP